MDTERLLDLILRWVSVLPNANVFIASTSADEGVAQAITE